MVEAELGLTENQAPQKIDHIHLMGICGTGMASLAGMLKQKGFHVTGSDQNVYPPMSLFLEGLGIQVVMGYGPENLIPEPDLVIVGNVITRKNPEAVALSKQKIPYLSFPQALGHFAFKDKKTIVVSGTHGKTTTASMAAWVLDAAGFDPGFMIGGIPKNFKSNFKLGQGDFFVLEGDEYDTAFFDKGPKFLHYNPWVAILTSIEFDHADIYRDLDHVIENFNKLICLVPKEGLLIANGDDPIILEQIQQAQCRVVTYGFSEDAIYRAVDMEVEADFTRVTILKSGKAWLRLRTPLYGRHNISNLLSIAAMVDFTGVSVEDLSRAFETFEGIKRRQDIVGEKNGILVLDDFAHHPTAVKETIAAVKEKYQNRRVIAVFEPRSNSSRRNIFQQQYAEAFEKADQVMIPEPPMMEKIPMEERFSSRQLTEDLEKRGLKSTYFQDTDQLLDAMVKEAHPGDVFLIMSNGGFDNIHQRLIERL